MADNWWGGWIHQNIAEVKAKSAKAMELLKCDLAEFTQVIQNDTVTTIAATALAFKEKLNVEESTEGSHKVSKGLSSFLGAISEAFAPVVGEPDTPHVKTVQDIQLRIGEPYDGVKVRLCNLQTNPATYCAKPDEQYNVWLSGFSLEDEKCTISSLLVDSPEIRDLYAKLVPSEVAHNDFWCRYFYRVHQLHQEEARRTALKERAEQTIHSEDLKWEDDEDELNSSSINVGAECRPNDVNLETEDMHNSFNPRGTSEKSGNSLEEAGQRITMASLLAGTSHETQLFAKLSDEDSEIIKCKSLVEGPSKISEPLLKIERKQSSKSTSKEEGKHNELFEGKSVGEDASDSECPLSTSNLRNFMLSPSNTDQNSRLKFDSSIKESTLVKVTENTLNSAENWDEDIDLDMTEEEIQMTLSQAEDLGELEIEDWEDWVCEKK
ncbi:BSD domain-containing protein 1-like isoform X1 [Pristis pectinata]|uniref:BSD domain-containing protein 1-like isoform X1 n=2 Tax=Pristis pectinata TaxID=685728 RepID=UPI00223E6561|nr:BSD domain-containing protein 1-like isoform X1 [Pristis pectinata]